MCDWILRYRWFCKGANGFYPILLPLIASLSGHAKGCLIDPSRTTVQDSLIRAVISVKIAVRPCEAALKWMAALEGVQEVMSLSGDIDALVRCVVPDVAALTALNDRLGASDLIASARSNVVLQVIR